MSNRRVAVLVLTVFVLATAGCGKGSNRTAVTRADLIAKANLICRRLTTTLHSVTIGIGTVEQDYALLLPPVAAFEHSAVAALATVTPPASLAGDWKRILADLQILAVNATRTAEYARSRDLTGLTGLTSSNNEARRRIYVAASRDGFSECVRFAD